MKQYSQTPWKAHIMRADDCLRTAIRQPRVPGETAFKWVQWAIGELELSIRAMGRESGWILADEAARRALAPDTGISHDLPVSCAQCYGKHQCTRCWQRDIDALIATQARERAS